MQKILVSGANGFAGSSVVDTAIELGYEVTRIVRTPQDEDEYRNSSTRTIVADLSKRDKVADIDFGVYGAVINLAGIARNDPSEQNPDFVIINNFTSQLNVAHEMIAQGADRTRLVSVGSGAIYLPGESGVVNELSRTKDPNQSTAYVKSKLMCRDALLKLSNRLDLAIAHPFNHTGRKQKPGFLVSDWALKLRKKYDGLALPDTSKLSSQVNMSHVIDIARAYIALATSKHLDGDPEYVIGSPTSISALAIVELLSEELVTTVPRTILAPSNPSIVDASHIQSDTSWRRMFSTKDAIIDFADWYKSQN